MIFAFLAVYIDCTDDPTEEALKNWAHSSLIFERIFNTILRRWRE